MAQMICYFAFWYAQDNIRQVYIDVWSLVIVSEK